MLNARKLWKLGRKDGNTGHFDVNNDGELVVREGNYQYNVFDIVRKLNSPVEIFLPSLLEQRLGNLLEMFKGKAREANYKGKITYHYPMKVNQNKEVVLTLVSEGAHLEVASANELWLVQRLWQEENFSSKIRVLCNGPKTSEYLKLINKLADNRLSIVPIIENNDELDVLKDFKGEIGVRINLKTKVKSHWDNQFDRFGLTSQEILEIGKFRNLKILHYHIGSQIERERDMIMPLREAFRTYVELKKRNPSLDTIDIGGGLAVPYEKRRMYKVENVAKKICEVLVEMSEEAQIPQPNLIIEWGRYVAAPSQFTVYKVVAEKELEKGPVSSWYIIDGSFMNDLLDTWALHQKWHIVPVNAMDAEHRKRVWLAGLSCDADDQYTASEGFLLMPRLDELRPGEDLYIAILDTGAYQDAFASHHCLLGSPAKIVLQNGLLSVARKREGPQEIGKLFGW